MHRRGRQIGQQALGERLQVAGLAPRIELSLVGAREQQQLVHQPRGTVAGLDGVVERGLPLSRVRRGPRHFGLRADRRDRRAQFVGRVRSEAPLRCERVLDARQQAVEALHHRCNLLRQSAQRHRLEVLRAAPRELVAERTQWAQSARDHPPHGHGQQRQGDQQRQQGVERDAAGDPVARRMVLAHLDQQLAVLAPGAEHAPVLAVEQRIAEALFGRRQPHGRRVGRAQVEDLAAAPHLERHGRRVARSGFIVVEIEFLDFVAGLGHEQPRGLLEMRIEQLVDLALGIVVGQQRHGRPRCRDGRQQQDQQAAAQGMRGRISHRRAASCSRRRAPCGSAPARACGAGGARALRWRCCRANGPTRRAWPPSGCA